MKCYSCSRCGNCKFGRLVPFGECPRCGLVNPEDAVECSKCGYRFPPRPGQSGKAREDGGR